MSKDEIGQYAKGVRDPKSLEELLDEAKDSDWFYWSITREMARRLRQLAERHRQDVPGLSRFYAGCSAMWPCPDAQILEGRDGE